MSQRVVISRRLIPTVQTPPMSNVRVAVMLFIVAEVMLFGTLIAGYYVLRMGSDNFAGMGTLPVGLTGISTAVLIMSSAALVTAQVAMSRGMRSLFKWTCVATLMLACLFITLQYIEWTRLSDVGLVPSVAINSGLFYMLSGVHGFHVLGGLVVLTILCIKAVRGTVSTDRRAMIDIASAYWHFVTIVWIVLFLILFIV